MVACGTCDNVFMETDRRHTCPLCGGDPTIELMDLGQPGEEMVEGTTAPSEVEEFPGGRPIMAAEDLKPPKRKVKAE